MATQGEALPSKKHLPYGGARAIDNHVINEFINFTLQNDFLKYTKTPTIVDDFLVNYVSWLKSSDLNTLSGFE